MKAYVNFIIRVEWSTNNHIIISVKFDYLAEEMIVSLFYKMQHLISWMFCSAFSNIFFTESVL